MVCEKQKIKKRIGNKKRKKKGIERKNQWKEKRKYDAEEI